MNSTKTSHALIFGARLALAALLCMQTKSDSAELTYLGSLPEYNQFVPVGLSDDASVVAGKLRVLNDEGGPLAHSVFRWTQESGMQNIGTAPGADVVTVIEFGGPTISGDGTTIVGKATIGCGTDDEVCDSLAVRYTSETGFQPLEGAVADIHSSALGVSYDGRVIVGGIGTPYRWTEASGVVDLKRQFSTGWSVTSDGNTVATGTHATGTSLWRSDTGHVDLGFDAGAPEISADGSTVVAQVFRTDKAIIRWTETAGVESLGIPDGVGDYEFGFVTGVNGDGSVFVGYIDDPNDTFTRVGTHAFVWSEEFGHENLQQALVERHGMGEALEGWHLRAAMAITPDSRGIVGFAAGPNSEFDAWLIQLDRPFAAVPEPGALGILVLGVVPMLHYVRRTIRCPV